MQPCLVQQLSVDPPITLMHLRGFTGSDHAFLSRIPPSTSGIYAWYQPFEFRDDPEGFYQDLLASLQRKKFADRTNTLGPAWKVTLSSESGISSTKKRRLDDTISSALFRSYLQASLSLSVYFQSPLYIGRAQDLRSRIEQHIANGSPLRTRLEAIQIDIRKCSLLFVPLISDTALDQAEMINDDWDELYEEIFSRLFEPRFTMRYG
jgi:hypothetical protein